jgi:hypothetical protein
MESIAPAIEVSEDVFSPQKLKSILSSLYLCRNEIFGYLENTTVNENKDKLANSLKTLNALTFSYLPEKERSSYLMSIGH